MKRWSQSWREALQNPENSSHLPESLAEASHDEMRLQHNLSIKNIMDFSKLLVVGSAGFAIVVFNSITALLNVKMFASGFPLALSIGIGSLAFILVFSFVGAAATFMSAVGAQESFSFVCHAMAISDELKFASRRKDFLNAMHRTGMYLIWSIALFLFSLLLASLNVSFILGYAGCCS
jgi:hypothetical protein